MRIGIGSDHAGFEYKQALIAHLQGQGYDVKDYGAETYAAGDDYPTYIRPVAEAVAAGEVDRGIVLGGSGNGEAIVANRVRGVRCPVVWTEETAQLGRRHNDANCISIGQRMVSLELAKKMVDVYLTEPFDGGRHAHRIALIDGDSSLEDA
jgi:ribose 5-phosphate isomerase B